MLRKKTANGTAQCCQALILLILALTFAKPDLDLDLCLIPCGITETKVTVTNKLVYRYRLH